MKNPPEAVFASYLIRLRLLDKTLLPEFVFQFFQTYGFWKSIKEGSAGSAQGGFNATKLGALSIPVPPLAEQKQIVAKLDALAAETRRLETLYTQKLAALAALKKSLLHQAFSGEL